MVKFYNKTDETVEKIKKHYSYYRSYGEDEKFKLGNFMAYYTHIPNKLPMERTGFSDFMAKYLINKNPSDIECIEKPVDYKDKDTNTYRAPYIKISEIKDKVKIERDQTGQRYFYYGEYPQKYSHELKPILKQNIEKKEVGKFPIDVIVKDKNGRKIKKKFLLPIYEYNGQRFIYIEEEHRKGHTEPEYAIYTFEPVKWIVDRNGYAHTEKQITYGSEEYLKNLDTVLNMHNIQKSETRLSIIQNLVKEIKEYAKNYDNEDYILEMVADLLAKYNEDINDVKTKEKNNSLSSNSADGLYKILLVNLSNILDGLKNIKENNFQKTLFDEISNLKRFINENGNDIEKNKLKEFESSTFNENELLKQLVYLKFGIDQRQISEKYYEDYNMTDVHVK